MSKTPENPRFDKSGRGKETFRRDGIDDQQGRGLWKPPYASDEDWQMYQALLRADEERDPEGAALVDLFCGLPPKRRGHVTPEK